MKSAPSLLTSGLALLLLMGCTAALNEANNRTERANTEAFEDQIPIPYQLAVCAGDYREALSILPPRYRDDPLTLFMAAYALEASGHAVRAHPHYQLLADNGFQDRVRIVCGGTALFDGALADVARTRAMEIERILIDLDADLAPTRWLHDGLPDQVTAETNSTENRARTSAQATPANNAEEGRVLRVGGRRSAPASSGVGQRQPVQNPAPQTVAVTRPDSLDPLGRWFVHLSSYFADDNADAGRAALSALYPAYSGLFDSWQVDLNGRRTWRLGIRLRDETEARSICVRLEAEGLYCSVFDSQAG